MYSVITKQKVLEVAKSINFYIYEFVITIMANICQGFTLGQVLC